MKGTVLPASRRAITAEICCGLTASSVASRVSIVGMSLEGIAKGARTMRQGVHAQQDLPDGPATRYARPGRCAMYVRAVRARGTPAMYRRDHVAGASAVCQRFPADRRGGHQRWRGPEWKVLQTGGKTLHEARRIDVRLASPSPFVRAGPRP